MRMRRLLCWIGLHDWYHYRQSRYNQISRECKRPGCEAVRAD